MFEALWDTEELFNLVAHSVKTEAKRVGDFSLERKNRIERFVQAAHKAVSVRSTSSNESLPTGISIDRTDERPHSVTDFDDQERPNQGMEDRDRGLRKHRNLKTSNYAYQSTQVIMLSFVGLGNYLFRKAVENGKYILHKQSAFYD